MKIKFNLNERDYEMDIDPSRRLLDFLREEMKMTSVKEGCSEGECGSCTVLIDRKAVCSCSVLAGQIDGKSLLTTEGLSDGEELNPLQKAFAQGGAIQCGYCTPGMLMSATALLYENPDPTEDEIRTAIAGNLCRCGDYSRVVRAIQKAAEEMQEIAQRGKR